MGCGCRVGWNGVRPGPLGAPPASGNYSPRSCTMGRRFLEGLESRQFFSSTPLPTNVQVPNSDLRHGQGRHDVAYTQYQISTKPNGHGSKSKVTPNAGYATPVGYSPSQVRKA